MTSAVVVTVVVRKMQRPIQSAGWTLLWVVEAGRFATRQALAEQQHLQEEPNTCRPARAIQGPHPACFQCVEQGALLFAHSEIAENFFRVACAIVPALPLVSRSVHLCSNHPAALACALVVAHVDFVLYW